MKVSTKLITVLAAPVVVLVIIAVFGVTTRRSEANDANRVAELTEFIQVDSQLVDELQKEAIWSAAYMSTIDETLNVDQERQDRYKSELNAQRQRTDAADVAYREAVKNVQPGRDNPAAEQALKAADARLNGLRTSRATIDGIQSVPVRAIESFTQLTTALIDVNSSLVQSANDAELLLGLTTVANYERVKEARATEAWILTSVVVRHVFTNESGAPCVDVNELGCVSYVAATNASNDVAQATDTFNEFARPEDKSTARDAEAGLAFDDLKKDVLEQGQENNVVLESDDEFIGSSLEMVNKLKGVEAGFITQVDETAQSLASDASSAAFLFFLFTLVAVVAALVIAFLVARATTVPLRKLTGAAYTLSTDKLPGLVERLRNPDESDEPLSATLTPIDINSKDEIGQLADAFNSIQQVTVEVAEEQAQLLRKGIGDIFINLARRNQTLLDRQIEFIDQLEANEEDPDQLDNLFKLDHLATRMRRNAESLLVLAGAEPPRRRGRPVALADVVRVAIGEVEDFARIQLLALDEATVGGNVAVDLAHLLSELMENATHFSPPDTIVEIVGHRADDRSYVISVSDQGIGMSGDQLAEANIQLARPPLVGLALSRSLGFIVIGRLAQRFGISVKLTASPSGGVTALVTLPRDLVTYADEPETAPAPEAAPTSDTLPAREVGPAAFAPPAPPAPAEAPASDLAPEPERSELPPPPVPPETPFVESVDITEDEALPPPPEPVAEAPGIGEDDADIASLDEDIYDEPVASSSTAVFGDVPSDDLLDELVEEVVPEGDEFERGLQSLVDDELAPGPIEPPAPTAQPSEVSPAESAGGVAVEEAPAQETVAPPSEPVSPEPAMAEPATAAATTAEAELTAAGLVRRTPKKRSSDQVGGGMPTVAPARAAGQSGRSPEEVRKMLSRYRSGLNKGRGDADSESTS
jgi:signal transduction histidine kinase